MKIARYTLPHTPHTLHTGGSYHSQQLAPLTRHTSVRSTLSERLDYQEEEEFLQRGLPPKNGEWAGCTTCTIITKISILLQIGFFSIPNLFLTVTARLPMLYTCTVCMTNIVLTNYYLITPASITMPPSLLPDKPNSNPEIELIGTFETQLSSMKEDLASKQQMLSMYETSMADLSSKVHHLKKTLDEKVRRLLTSLLRRLEPRL